MAKGLRDRYFETAFINGFKIGRGFEDGKLRLRSVRSKGSPYIVTAWQISWGLLSLNSCVCSDQCVKEKCGFQKTGKISAKMP